MKLNQAAKTFETNAEVESQDFTIGAVSVVIEILRNKLYRHKVRTLVQEYISNGRTHGYAKGFGPKLIEVKVNPKDVVAVPTDYNGTKMRVCKFEVLAECEALIEGPVYKPETFKKSEPTKPKAKSKSKKKHAVRGKDGKFIKKSK